MLLAPIITEKTMREAAKSRYTFLVERGADKRSIAREVKDVFGVTVKRVETVTIAGKDKRFSRRAKLVRGEATKKAIVSLTPGQTLDLFEVKEEKEVEEKKEEKK